MALTRAMLKAMGIEAEKIDQIIDAHTETTNALIKDRDEYKANSDKLVSVQKELDTLKTTASGDWKVKYEKEHTDFEEYKTSVAKEKAHTEKANLYKSLLKANNIDEKRIDTILRVTDVDALEIKDGKFANEVDLNKSITADWADFIVKEGTKGASVDNPPQGTSNVTKDAYNKMSLSEKMAYANSHPEEMSALLA